MRFSISSLRNYRGPWKKTFGKIPKTSHGPGKYGLGLMPSVPHPGCPSSTLSEVQVQVYAAFFNKNIWTKDQNSFSKQFINCLEPLGRWKLTIFWLNLERTNFSSITIFWKKHRVEGQVTIWVIWLVRFILPPTLLANDSLTIVLEKLHKSNLKRKKDW